MELENEILALETQVWEALKAGDAAADAALLADDFLGVYPTGFRDKEAHTGQLKAGPSVETYKLLEPHFRVFSTDCVLISYRACWSRRAEGALEEEMFVSSLWVRREGVWKNIFSQDTPVS